MAHVKSQLLFSIDRPEHHSELIYSLYHLNNVNVLRIRNMDFNQMRSFVTKRRNCVLLLFIEENKGAAMSLLYNMYNSCFRVPYIISVFQTNRKRFLEHVQTCGISKLFCANSKNYSDLFVIKWVRRICRYMNMNSVFPSSQSYADSYVRYKISEKLKNMGMSCYLTGYKYIVDAIELYIKDLSLYITSDVYKALSIRYKTKVANIDRCMRHAIEVTWRDNSFDCLEKYYPNSSKVYEERPSVLEFVNCLTKEIKRELIFK